MIPAEAVEAARKALKYYGGIDDSYAAMKILKAALPYLMGSPMEGFVSASYVAPRIVQPTQPTEAAK